MVGICDMIYFVQCQIYGDPSINFSQSVPALLFLSRGMPPLSLQLLNGKVQSNNWYISDSTDPALLEARF